MEGEVRNIPEINQDSQTYEIGDSTVRVGWKRFDAKKEGDNAVPTGSATIFLMGWALTENSRSIQDLSQAFADSSSAPVFAVSTKPDEVRSDSLNTEAKAIGEFVKERGLEELIIAGLSEGGTKAVDLVSSIEELNKTLPEDKQIKIRGLVLLNPVGVFEQKNTPFVEGAKLTGNFLLDLFVTSPVAVVKDMILYRKMRDSKIAKNLLAAQTDILSGVYSDVKRFGKQYPIRLLSQIKEMTTLNPRLAEIESPIILIQGRRDPISNMANFKSDIENATWVQRVASDEKGAFYENLREQALKKVFPKSPYIRALEPEKLGHHPVSLLRPEEIARSSTNLLRRYWRNQPQKTSEVQSS